MSEREEQPSAERLEGRKLAEADHREVLRLDARESAAFAEMVLNPPEPVEALRRAASEYRKSQGSR